MKQKYFSYSNLCINKRQITKKMLYFHFILIYGWDSRADWNMLPWIAANLKEKNLSCNRGNANISHEIYRLYRENIKHLLLLSVDFFFIFLTQFFKKIDFSGLLNVIVHSNTNGIFLSNVFFKMCRVKILFISSLLYAPLFCVVDALELMRIFHLLNILLFYNYILMRLMKTKFLTYDD